MMMDTWIGEGEGEVALLVVEEIISAEA